MKRLIIVLCVVLMVVSLTACSGGGDNNAATASLQSENEALKQENAKLLSQISELQAQLNSISERQEQIEQAESKVQEQESKAATDTAEMKDNPKVLVTNARIRKGTSRVSPRYEVNFTVTNNTKDWVVKQARIYIYGFDENGYPVKIGNYSSDEYDIFYLEDNIQPNEDAEKKYYSDIAPFDTKAATFIYCVKQVEFYEGMWENPYFDKWVAEFVGKKLDVDAYIVGAADGLIKRD